VDRGAVDHGGHRQFRYTGKLISERPRAILNQRLKPGEPLIEGHLAE
jgi:hypothetical protein